MRKLYSVLLHTLILLGIVGCTMEVETPLPAITVPSPTTLAPPLSDNTTPSNSSLSGRLIYTTVSTEGGAYVTQIQMLDLATNGIKTIFRVTGNAWIYYLTVSPNADQLLMSYTPPSQPGAESATSLYTLPLEEAASPNIVFEPATIADRYLQVEWSPDGKYIFFVHYNHDTQPPDQPYPNYEILRMAYPDGEPEKILDRAFWPRISSDSSKLVYVTLDPVSGLNQLFFANVDGSDPQEIPVAGLPSPIMDAPIFSPDGQSILFSAPSPAQSYQPNWLDRLMGVRIVKAHNVPSDWWSVPISGGEPMRLTRLQTIKLFASISPDKTHIASVSGEGIFVMDMDGSNLIQVVSDPGVSSVVNWIP